MPHIHVILVRPQHPGNIGAAARAIGNFGFYSLRLVTPRCDHLVHEAARRSVGGSRILKEAAVFPTVDAAVADCHRLYGTSRRTGRHRQFIAPGDLATACRAQPSTAHIGLLFGSEEWGLTNKELARCHGIVAIPTSPTIPSINLSHAVAILASHLYAANEPLAGQATESPAPVTMEALEAMYGHLEQGLAAIGFFPHGEPFHVMRALRGMLNRAGLSSHEVAMLRGVARQMAWVGDPPQGPDPKRGT
jgi:TrmH family RNA methyltransferase